MVRKRLKTSATRTKVLDLGCGTGMAGRALRKVGFLGSNIVGVDISPKSVEMAKEVYEGGCFVGSLEEPLSADALGAGPFESVIC